ncbi:MAG: hypothetical protein RLZZ579_106, partial [Actinomycetota bacterium]
GRKKEETAAHPWTAAWASMVAFTSGALLPLAAITIPPTDIRIPVTVGSVVLALAITGFWAAKVGGSNPTKSVVRNVAVSILTMALSYGVGALLGTTVLA